MHCTKCKRLCKGHAGPYGPNCTLAPLLEEKVEGAVAAQDAGTQQQQEFSQVIKTLVAQQAELAAQLAAMAEKQEKDRQKILQQMENATPKQTPPTTAVTSATALGKITEDALTGKYIPFEDVLDYIKKSHHNVDEKDTVTGSDNAAKTSAKQPTIGDFLTWLRLWNVYEGAIMLGLV